MKSDCIQSEDFIVDYFTDGGGRTGLCLNGGQQANHKQEGREAALKATLVSVDLAHFRCPRRRL